MDVTDRAPSDQVEPDTDASRPPEPGGVASPVDAVPGGVLTRRAASSPFEVHLDVFSGPFELLLGLISKHKLDVTEIALAKVTDEFIAHIRNAQEQQADWDLGQASEFVLIAATLLDIKAARLLPDLRADDDDDLALIEARDLLFARLLQYRAFKEVSADFAERMASAGRMTARQAGLEERFAKLLPELIMNVTPDQLARIAATAMTPRPEPTVGLTHLHAPAVSVREQAAIVIGELRDRRQASFRSLVSDADSTLVIVARFLALLELYKESAITMEQPEALGELMVHWTGDDRGNVEVSAEFDELDHDTPADGDPANDTDDGTEEM
ncbi:segregation and condensation protein A [Flexivirga oryzae]|uniref:Segregation and condensation protein A n=1 Tax=Flexivirga oryzae TaxID=1794944 RepID=A0A839N4S8_9MICO|nr:ScpA family protein [Flexivirga oryzae]MBB2891759.1 segregation and condensation protein A [Flexivirga oryzae]